MSSNSLYSTHETLNNSLNRSQRINNLNRAATRTLEMNRNLDNEYYNNFSISDIEDSLNRLKMEKNRLCEEIVLENEELFDRILKLGKNIISEDGGYLLSIQNLNDSEFRTADNILKAAKRIKHERGLEYIKDELNIISSIKRDIIDKENRVLDIVDEKLRLKYLKKNEKLDFLNSRSGSLSRINKTII